MRLLRRESSHGTRAPGFVGVTDGQRSDCTSLMPCPKNREPWEGKPVAFDPELIAAIRRVARTRGEMTELLSVLLSSFSEGDRQRIIANLARQGILEPTDELWHSAAGAISIRPTPAAVPRHTQERLLERLLAGEESQGVVELDQNSFARTVLQDMAAADRVISLNYTGRQLFPAFQFEPGGEEIRLVRFSVQRANQVLRAGVDPWGAIGWWLAPNGWIRGSAPADLLGTEEEETVTQLAESVLATAG